jgi:hypothetical protein
VVEKRRDATAAEKEETQDEKNGFPIQAFGNDKLKNQIPLFCFGFNSLRYWIKVEKLSKGVQFLTCSELFPLFIRRMKSKNERISTFA